MLTDIHQEISLFIVSLLDLLLNIVFQVLYLSSAPDTCGRFHQFQRRLEENKFVRNDL